MSRDRLNELEDHIKGLPDQERRALGAEAHEHERGVFDLVQKGDAAGLFAALKREPALIERQDENGMTPLHWAGLDKSGLLFDVMTQESSAAPWTRDQAGRLPLDVMREAGRHAVADKAERVTYPKLFRDEQNGPVEQKKVAAFSAKYDALGKPDTSPTYARNLEPLAKAPEPGRQGRDHDERER